MDIAPYVYRRFVVAHGRRPNHDDIPQYYMRQLIGEFILHLNVDYTDFGSEFYGVGKGRLVDRQHAHRRIPRPIPRSPVAQFLVMAHPEAVGRVSHHLTRVSETIRADMQHTLHSVRGIVSSQIGPTGPSHSGGDHANSRPSHGDRSHVPRYVSNDEVYHMSVEDLRSLHFECRDYIHGTDYVDSAYDMEHGQASFLNAIVDDTCREYVTSASMPTNMQSFLESSVATAYERVGGAGPSREFEEPRVDLTFDLTQQWPSYTGPETVQIKHSEKPSVDLSSCTATPETHDFVTSPLGAEVTTCLDTSPMASIPENGLDKLMKTQRMGIGVND
eukprot:Gb_17487 [translate_table: standard]